MWTKFHYPFNQVTAIASNIINENLFSEKLTCMLKIYVEQAQHYPTCQRPHWTNKIQHPATKTWAPYRLLTERASKRQQAGSNTFYMHTHFRLFHTFIFMTHTINKQLHIYCICPSLVNGIWTFPTALEIINNANCTFEVMLAPSSYSNTTGKLIVDGIVQYTKMKDRCPAQFHCSYNIQIHALNSSLCHTFGISTTISAINC